MRLNNAGNSASEPRQWWKLNTMPTFVMPSRFSRSMMAI
jgi:hypothetical protein